MSDIFGSDKDNDLASPRVAPFAPDEPIQPWLVTDDAKRVWRVEDHGGTHLRLIDDVTGETHRVARMRLTSERPHLPEESRLTLENGGTA